MKFNLRSTTTFALFQIVLILPNALASDQEENRRKAVSTDAELAMPEVANLIRRRDKEGLLQTFDKSRIQKARIAALRGLQQVGGEGEARGLLAALSKLNVSVAEGGTEQELERTEIIAELVRTLAMLYHIQAPANLTQEALGAFVKACREKDSIGK